jgi:LacI family transcriptional regulator
MPARPMSKVTRADVARHAGTSTAVVSYVLNNGPRPVAAATRQRVQAAIDLLGYRPDRIARALAAQRSEALGLVVADTANPFIRDLSSAVESAAFERGFTVLLGNSTVDHSRERRHLQHFLDHRVDGLLVVPVGLDDATVNELNQSGTPIVVLDRPIPRLRAHTILVDNAGGAAEVTSHLASHGHRRIACIAGPLPLYPAAERERGWAQAVTDAGLARSRCPVVRTSVSRRSGYEAALELLHRPHPPTAIFAVSDEQAIGVLRAVADLGRRVPDDVAVGAFDGIAQGVFSIPGLTTASQPVDQMAQRAVSALLEAVGRGPVTRATREILPVHLVRRGSCGCPDTVNERGTHPEED